MHFNLTASGVTQPRYNSAKSTDKVAAALPDNRNNDICRPAGS
jgi:hypothetical protein